MENTNFWFEKDASKLHAVGKAIKDYAPATVIGAGAGAAHMATRAALHNKFNDWFHGGDKKRKVSVKHHAILGATLGGGAGIYIKHQLSHSNDRWNQHHGSGQQKAYNSFHLQGELGLTGKETTKAEVKRHLRDLAKKHHPDAGGSEKKMKEINNHFDQLKTTPWFQKLAFWQGFTGTPSLY